MKCSVNGALEAAIVAILDIFSVSCAPLAVVWAVLDELFGKKGCCRGAADVE